MIVKTTEELKKYTDKLRLQEYVALDTEFMREKTYWPIACLIQVAGEDGIEFCIDPLDENVDLKPFFGLLSDGNVVKVFHAARQDIEIFFNMTGEIPSPIFDTQVAAMVCGLGDSISYKDLVRNLLKVNLDKGMRYTDWSRRPLDERQLVYAMSDVTYLREAYKVLKAKLVKNGREHWIDEEMECLTDLSSYNLNPDEVWHRFRPRGMSQKSLSVLKSLSRWRENKAREKNRPRGHVLKDAVVQEIAAFRPVKMEDLKKIRGISETGRYNQEILDAVAEGLESGEDLREQAAKDPVKHKALVELLRVLLHIKAEETKVALRIIADGDELAEIADSQDGAEPDVPALKGWRREIFGEDALRLKAGELAITYDPKKSRIVLKPLVVAE